MRAVCLGFDLHQMVRVDERGDLHHRRHRADLGEDLTMGRADRLPVGDVDEEDPRPHDLLEGCTGLAESAADDPQDHACLLAGVADTDHLAADGGGRSGNVHVVAGTRHAAVPDDALPGPAGAPAPNLDAHPCSIAHMSAYPE